MYDVVNVYIIGRLQALSNSYNKTKKVLGDTYGKIEKIKGNFPGA